MCAQIGKQTHIDTFCGTFNLKLWSPHIRTTCVPQIGKQTYIYAFCGTYHLKLWPPHIETTCVPHIEKQSLYVATHPILVLYECYYMWPHIVPFLANYLPHQVCSYFRHFQTLFLFWRLPLFQVDWLNFISPFELKLKFIKLIATSWTVISSNFTRSELPSRGCS